MLNIAWMLCVCGIYFVLFRIMCVIGCLSYNESHFSLNKSVHTPTDKSYHGTHAAHRQSAQTHTHVQSLFIVFALSCDCHVQWPGQKSFSSLSNNHLIIVNSLNRISIDGKYDALTESDENKSDE